MDETKTGRPGVEASDEEEEEDEGGRLVVLKVSS